MPNRIREVELRTQRADPVEAEVLVEVTAEQATPTTEVRGRCVGPKCAGRTTIEVAYPLRSRPSSTDGLAARVVIPEPSLWSQGHPFVYDFLIELWQDGQRCDQRVVAGHRLLSSRPAPKIS